VTLAALGRRRCALSTMLLLAVVAGVACRREAGESPARGGALTTQARVEPTARVRVIDAIPDSRPLDVYAGDQPAFAGVQFRAVTAYQEIAKGTTPFRLRPAGQDRADPLAESSEGLAGGGHYTVVALPGSGSKPAGLKVLKDEFATGSSGKARVRVVNASPDAGDVSVFVGGRTGALVSGVAAAAATGYKDVDPIAGTLELRQESRKQVLARLPDTRLESGGFYTVFLLGRLAGGLEAMVVEDQRGPAL
jgi:hypothetical protein